MAKIPMPKMMSWPLGRIVEGEWSWSTEEKSIREVMLNILLTRQGERLMRPEFGAGLLNFIHQPNNETTRQLIAQAVKKSLGKWEIRVVVDDVTVTPSPTQPAEVHIVISYHLRHKPMPAELSLRLNLGES